MTLALRRTVFLDGERRPDDYGVRHDGRTVGRIYRMNSTGRGLWRSAQFLQRWQIVQLGWSLPLVLDTYAKRAPKP